MKTAIVTDTNSGMSIAEGNERGIFVLPMPVIIDGEEYLEGKNITHTEVYQALAQRKDVMTSQPSPGDVTQMWQKALESGYDEVVYIPMSSGLSSACDTGKLLAQDFDGKVHVIDNHRISLTLYESILDAKYLADQGWSGRKIAEYLIKEAYYATIYITVSSVEYLKKSGRITNAGVQIASLLNIKPILTIQGGKLDAFARVRGMRSALRHMITAVKNDLEDLLENVPGRKAKILSAGTLRTEEEIAGYAEKIQKEFPGYDFEYHPLSCSIACHTGPDTIGVGFVLVHEER